MKKILFSLFITFICSLSATAQQDTLNLNIRDINISSFQKIKLYLNILDNKGKPVLNIDSSRISIKENETGKKVNPRVENFYNSNEGIAICVAIDASNSMEGPPLDNVKEGLLSILSGIRTQDKMAIGYFHDEFRKKTDFATDREILRNNITELQTGGSSTELYKSVMESIKWLQSFENPKRKILIIISDGEDNGSTYKLEDVMTEVTKSEFSVFTIGSVADKRESRGFLVNMEKIANASKEKGGSYYKISKPEDIKNIIPAIYQRIKDEYVLTYFSSAEPNTPINGALEVKSGNLIVSSDFKYQAPATIVENAPGISFWKSSEFLYGSIIVGVVLIGLTVLIIFNVQKKKKFKSEKEEERRLRELEAKENQERFDSIRLEYDDLLDRLENQQVISQSDKDKISALESHLENASKTIPGASAPIDYRRRTMILTGKPPESDQNFPKTATLTIRNGLNAGRQIQISPYGMVIGRTEGNVNLQDDTISRQHARVVLNQNNYFIEDMNSSNGTFLNNKKINSSVLKTGDIIKIGNTELIFQL
jgi:VWFA-related protein